MCLILPSWWHWREERRERERRWLEGEVCVRSRISGGNVRWSRKPVKIKSDKCTNSRVQEYITAHINAEIYGKAERFLSTAAGCAHCYYSGDTLPCSDCRGHHCFCMCVCVCLGGQVGCQRWQQYSKCFHVQVLFMKTHKHTDWQACWNIHVNKTQRESERERDRERKLVRDSLGDSGLDSKNNIWERLPYIH